MKSEISVVHLAYVPYGTELFEKFLHSYARHQAGIEHQLVILFNGFDRESEIEPFLKIIDAFGIDYETILSPEKYDISSYFYAAKNLDSEYLLFLNSFSVILADDWLRIYYAAMQKQPDVGVIGATGAGWRSEFRRYLRRIKINTFAGEFKSLIFMWLNYRRFRGPHIRTTAFFIKRKVFLSLKYYELTLNFLSNHSEKDSKHRTLYFEHGNRNMTYQLTEMGLKTLVIDKYGKTYEPKDWMSAKTFWISEQENLLVHDNRTMTYQNGDKKVKEELSHWAWKI